MPRRRVLAVALTGVLLAGIAGAVSPQVSVAAGPSAAQLAAAAQRVAAAQQGLVGRQQQAEIATEAYDTAQSRADAAAATAAGAATAATQAQAVADQAAADSAAAQGIADAAAVASDQARQVHQRAEAAATAAQTALDQLAAGAYRAGGNLALLTTLFAADPLSFATGQAMIDRVDRNQEVTVDALTRARAGAAATALLADQAAVAAGTEAQAVATRAADAATASAAARSAAATAAAAAAAAVASAQQAAGARQHALVLVASAEQSLGAATANSADLASQASQARAVAVTTQQQMPPGGQPVSGSAAATALRWAYQEIGVPYSWGGGNASGPTYGIAQGAHTLGFDCSGLTLFAWAHAGVVLPHSAALQYDAGRHVGYAQLAPGDLIFYATSTSDPSTIHHVTIYIGGGKMIEAPHTGSVVQVSTVYTSGLIGGVRLTG